MLKIFDEFDSIWEVMLFIFISIFLFFLLAMTIQYAFSSKEFKGYYLYHGDEYYSIEINWENAPDEIAYKTFNGKEALRVLKQLQEESNNK